MADKPQASIMPPMKLGPSNLRSLWCGAAVGAAVGLLGSVEVGGLRVEVVGDVGWVGASVGLGGAVVGSDVVGFVGKGVVIGLVVVGAVVLEDVVITKSH